MMKEDFVYCSGELVKIGDYVGLDQLDGNGVIKTGRVDEILVPGSEEADCYGCPDGGVYIAFDDKDLQLWTKPDEHLKFLARSPSI